MTRIRFAGRRPLEPSPSQPLSPLNLGLPGDAGGLGVWDGGVKDWVQKTARAVPSFCELALK
jgi:hypothetical protein